MQIVVTTGRGKRIKRDVPGTAGYARAIDRFVAVSLGLDFASVCKAFIPHLPALPARILDLGAGVGQNAAALSEMGYAVVAVDPMEPFLAVARARYPNLPVAWLRDSLPRIESLGQGRDMFDFVLVEAVWHHLSPAERTGSLERMASLLAPGGRVAISLRNGPAGLGTRVFPTEASAVIAEAKKCGLACIHRQENQPSILPDKGNVRWARIVLEKP